MADQLLNLKLVSEIEKHPCLYNYTLTDYSCKSKTETAWNDVGQKVNLSGYECKEKWKNLRSVFVRHMKPSPSGSSAKLKKPYYLADAMKFALPFIRALRNNTHENTPAHTQVKQETEQQEINSDLEENQLTLPSNYEMPSWSSLQSDPLPCSSPQAHSSRSSSPESYSPPPSSPQPSSLSYQSCLQNKNKRSQEVHTQDVLSENLRAKKNKTEEMRNLQQEANKMFLFSVIGDMQQMSPSQLRKFKIKVLESIGEVLDDKC